MNIDNADKRSDYWSERHKVKYQGSTPFNMLHKMINVFKDKDVLEVGPGEGRQFVVVKDICKSYSVMDISKDVLNNKLYESCNKYLLRSYNTSSYMKFDVIHFWYVIHHVLPDEVQHFIDMVHNHLKDDGIILCNYPLIDNMDQDSLVNDGMRTSMHNEKDILLTINQKFDIIERDTQDRRYMSIVARRKSVQ